jgi:hypothetical protein
MTGIRVLLIACLVSLCGTAWGADAPPIPAGARVGIIDLVTNDITHYHVGRSEVQGFLRTYRVNWAAGLIDDPLIDSLIGAGFQPVMAQATDTLYKERESWIVRDPRDKKLPRGCMKELGRILDEQDLDALIVVAPGANTEPESDERKRLTKLPKYTQGLGFSTSDEWDGITKPAVFDFTQMIVVAKTPEGPQLVARDWGGNRVYDWQGFDPGQNIKALSDRQLAPLRPVISEVMKQRIAARLIPTLKP